MPFTIIRQDITRVQADAIVNTANPDPQYGEGTDYAIYQAAGEEQLLEERRKIGKITPGEAAVTPALALQAKYIIHTVGPVWQGGESGEMETLASCYRKSLYLAETLRCKSVAFPLISAGTYGFPKEQALQIALDTIRDFCRESEMNVILAVFNKDAFRLSSELLDDVKQYVEDHYVEERWGEEHPFTSMNMAPSYSMPEAAISAPPKERRRKAFGPRKKERRKEVDEPKEISIEETGIYSSVTGGFADLEEHLEIKVGESFQEMLLRLIDERGLTDTQVYKKANIDRKLFSKIRCNPEYHPSKRTALALAIALELNLDQTVDLLSRAELAFSPSREFDLIVRYCIERQIYDVMEINAILFEYEQPLLA